MLTPLAIVFLVVSFGIYIWILTWLYEDAESRGVSGLMIVFLISLLNVHQPIGFILWFLFRPAKRKPF